MDDFPRDTFTGSPIDRTKLSSIQRNSRLWPKSKPGGTTTDANDSNKSIVHFSFEHDNSVIVTSNRPIQPAIENENGMIRRASRIHPKAIQTVVRNTPTESKNIRTNTFSARPTTTVLQSRGGRSNPRSRTSVSSTSSTPNFLSSTTNHGKNTTKPKRASEVQPVGQHVLLKRFTATSKAIEPLASRSTRSYKSFVQPNLNNKFSRVRTSSVRNFGTSENSSGDFGFQDISSNRNTAAKSGSDKTHPPNVYKSEALLGVDNIQHLPNVDEAETPLDAKVPESLSDVQQHLLDKFSAKAIDAAIRFTPSESSSADRLISNQRLLKKFCQRAINAAINPAPFPVTSGNNAMSPDGALSSFQFDSNSNNQTQDPEESSSKTSSSTNLEEKAEITSQQTVEEVANTNRAADDRSNSYDATRKFEAELEQIVEVPTELFQKSTKAVKSAAKSIPFVPSQLAGGSDAVTNSRNASFEPESKPVKPPQQRILERISITEIFAEKKAARDLNEDSQGFRTGIPHRAEATIAQDRLTPSSEKEAARDLNEDSQRFRTGIPHRAEAKIAQDRLTPSSAETDNRKSSSSSSSITKEEADLDVVKVHGLLETFSSEATDAAVQQPTSQPQQNPHVVDTESTKDTKSSSSSNSSFPGEEPDLEVEKVEGLLKKLSPEAMDAAVQQLASQPEEKRNVENTNSKKDSGYNSNGSDADVDLQTPPVNLKESNKGNRKVNPAPPKLFGTRPKKGGVLDTNEPKLIRICALGIPGHILYLEVYKDFIDLLLNLLTMRTGAVIKLLHEVDAGLDFGGYGGGILNIHDSLSKMDESILTDRKETLLNPNHKQNLTREFKGLGSFEPECCNPDCPKFVSSSRIVCKNCFITTHFSCSLCNAYFRENVHSTACLSPWRPWGVHASAAPVLNRYTVVQSVDAIVAPKSKKLVSRNGFVKPGVPFMITNDLNFKQLTTQSIAKILKALNFEDGGTEELDCHELLIGKTEVVFLLGAAMTSLTPLTDVFAHLCTSENKISANETLSRTASASEELLKGVFSIAKPIGDLMTYIRPLASGFAESDIVQQESETAVKRFSGSNEIEDSTVNENSLATGKMKERELSSVSSTKRVSSVSTARKKSSLQSTPQVSVLSPASTSILVAPQHFIPGIVSTTVQRKKSSVSATPQDLMSAASEAPSSKKTLTDFGLATAKEPISGSLEAAEKNVSVSTATQERSHSPELQQESHQTSASCSCLCNKIFRMRRKNRQQKGLEFDSTLPPPTTPSDLIAANRTTVQGKDFSSGFQDQSSPVRPEPKKQNRLLPMFSSESTQPQSQMSQPPSSLNPQEEKHLSKLGSNYRKVFLSSPFTQTQLQSAQPGNELNDHKEEGGD